MISVSAAHNTTAVFQVTVRARLTNGATTLRTERAPRLRPGKAWNEVLVLLGTASEVYDVTLKEYAESRVPQFGGDEPPRGN